MIYFIVVVITVTAILYSIFRSPLVQTYFARKAATYLSEELQADITIGGFNINFFLYFIIDDISVKNHEGDNILKADKILLNIDKIDIKNKFLMIKEVEFQKSNFNLVKYENDSVFNIQFLTDYFKSSKNQNNDSINDGKRHWAINCTAIKLSNTQFKYFDFNKIKKEKGVDFSHIDISSINMDLNEINYYEGTLYCRINNISFKESSGFVVEKFKGNFRISKDNIAIDHLHFVTPNSEISMNLKFLFYDFLDFNDFIRKVRIESTIGYSKLDLYDIGYFAPILFEMPNKLSLSGKVDGTVNDFVARNFKFSFGESTNFVGDISMKGLPYFDETLINFKIKDFYTNILELSRFALPGEDKFLKLPKMFSVLGDVNINGTFNGFVKNFQTKVEINTSIGLVSTNLALSTNLNTSTYQGTVYAGKFNIGKFLNISEYLGKMNFNSQFNGSGLTAESAVVELNGTVDSLDFRGNNYNKIDIKGLLENEKFSGLLEVEDDNIGLTFDGTIDFNQDVPVFDFYSEIKDANLYNLRFFDRNPEMLLSTNMNINFKGAHLDELEGSVSLDSTKYSEAGINYFMKNLSVTTVKDSALSKSIELNSDFIDSKIYGEFMFTSLYQSFCQFISKYLSAIELSSYDKIDSISNQKINFDVNLKNTIQLSKIFFPNLWVSPNTVFSGNFASERNLIELNGYSPLIVFNGIKFNEWKLNGTNNNEEILLTTSSESITLREPSEKDTLGLGIKNLVLTSNIKNDSLIFNFNWNDKFTDSRNIGNIDGYLALENSQKFDSKITDAEIKINKIDWNINKSNLFCIDTTSIQINDFEIFSDKQYFKLNGNISEYPSDSITLELKDWEFSNFDPLIKNPKLDFDGIFNGGMNLFDVYGSPYFFLNLNVKDLYFNEEKLGDAVLESNWDSQNKSIYSNAEIVNVGNVESSKILVLEGNYYPNSDSTNFDYDISLNNFHIKALTPFVSGFISKLKGIASGNLKLNSIKGKPNITGNVQLMRSEAKIDFINVSYSFAHQIDFVENEIVFENVILYDSLGNQAVANGKITHKNLNDFFVNIEISPQKLSCLNTTSYHNNLFYGSASASGNVFITGPFNNIVLDIAAATDKGTKVYIPISYDVDVAENDYIIFVNSSDTTEEAPTYDVDMGGFELNLEITATPDAEIELYLPFQLGRIQGAGDGDLKLSITPQGDFLMNGDYSIREGTFFFTMQNLINRNFEIMEGSEISWTGSPYDANINLRALYKVKTSIDGLGLVLDSTSGSGKRINVDCILELRNQLFDPDIHFSIQLPNTDEETQQAVYSILDTTNEVMMNQQMISLLLLGSFSYNTSTTASIGASSVNLISNQLSNWLSQISQDFDIGIHYRMGDQVSEEELEVALSTQLFNDRVLIDGNFGVVGNEKTSSTSNIVGDVNVEVKLTEDGRFRVKAFNRSNINSIYDINAFDDRSSYTQGVGVFYRKEFDSFGDLFRRKEKR